MSRKIPLGREKSSQQTTLRRSSRFLPRKIEDGGERPNSRKNQVRPSQVSSTQNSHSTEEIAPKKSISGRQSIRLMNSANESSKSVASLGSPNTPRVSDRKTASVITRENTEFVESGFSAKRAISEVTQEGICRNERRRSVRLMGFEVGVEDLSSSPKGRVFSEVAEKVSAQRKQKDSCRLMGSEKGGVYSSCFSEEWGSLNATQKEDGQNKRRRSLRLMGPGKVLQNLNKFPEKWKSLEVNTKGKGQNERRRSLRLMGFEKDVENLNGFSKREILLDVNSKGENQKELTRSMRLKCSVKGAENFAAPSEKQVSSAFTQKGDGRIERRRSLRLMGLQKGAENSSDFSKKGISEANSKWMSQEEQKNLPKLMGVSQSDSSMRQDFSVETVEQKEWQKSLTLMDSAQSVKSVSDFQEKHVFSGAAKKGGCEKEQRSSFQLMVSSKSVGKSEEGIGWYNKLEKSSEREARDAVISVAVMETPREGVEKKKRKVESRSDKSINEEACSVQGWTKEQEAALQKAYFVEKPSPHFWKKVSKLVPGKSAQECFDRIHATLVTPPHHQPCPRRKGSNSSPLSHFTIPESKLLESMLPNVKRPRRSKEKSVLAEKTVRTILRKHHIIDQGSKADLFSVFETAANPSSPDLSKTNMPSRPDCELKPLGFLQRCHNVSFEALSKLEIANQTDFFSPPVLKQVKNIVLHEKYIDQLHSRDARRKQTKSAQVVNSVAANDKTKGSGMLEADVIAARNALVSNARNVIRQFQDVQSVDMCGYEYSGLGDDDDNDSDDDFKDAL